MPDPRSNNPARPSPGDDLAFAGEACLAPTVGLLANVVKGELAIAGIDEARPLSVHGVE